MAEFNGPPGLGGRTALITSGTSLSSAVSTGQAGFFGIQMPAAWDAAGLSMQGSHDGNTWAEIIFYDGTPLAWVVAASQIILPQSPAQLLGLNFFKFRSGTSGVPVNQSANRTITLLVA